MKTNLNLSGLALGIVVVAFLFLPLLGYAAPQPNAWQISDISGSGPGASYSTTLPAPQQSAALSEGWRYTIHARFLDDFNDTATMVFLYGVGTDRFSIFWDLDANNDITVTPVGQPTLTLTTNGTGAAFYHTYEIAYNPASQQATFFFDGIQRAVWDGDNVTAANGLIAWGSGSSGGQGRMNFHTTTFRIGTNVVAAYDAGTQGAPPIAPDPRSQGWTATGASATTTNAISPDAVASPTPLAATTLAPTGLEPHAATLRGSVDLGGLAANVWFDWGTTTNYGNTSTPRFFKAGTNAASLSDNLTDLAAGATYHFRCVATNLLGIAYGQDVQFTTPPTWVVTSLANSGAGSLRQAIEDAIAGDTISFGVTGRIGISSQLDIFKSLNILGPGPANLRIDANGDSRVFRLISGTTNTFSGITITNGQPRAGALDGGGIHNSGHLTLSNCVIIGNSAGHGRDGLAGSGEGGPGGPGGHGGGIYSVGPLTLLSCAVTDNAAGDGGRGGDGAEGFYIGYDAGNGGNAGSGGGLFSSAELIGMDSVISLNRTGQGGDGGDGGDAVAPVFDIRDGVGGDGGDSGSGGGAYLTGTSTLIGCTLRSNTARGGGSEGAGCCDGSVRAGKDGSGGATSVASGTLALIECSLDDNHSAEFGGGLHIGETAGGVVRRSTFSTNLVSGGWGGGIASFGSLHVENSTFVRNQVLFPPLMAGVAIDSRLSPLTIINCTLVQNFVQSQQSEGAGVFSDSTIRLTNSVVAMNDMFDTWGNVVGANNLIGGNPELAPFGNYDGSTRTMPPRPGSPAINAGTDSVTNFLTVDQRGHGRRSGARVDIGAVEVHVSDPDNPLSLDQPERLGSGAMRLTLAGDPAAIAFSVYASTNVAAPANQWIRLGSTTQPSPGQYRYTDATATNHPNRFYKVVWP